MENNWISVDDELPPAMPGCRHVTDEVQVRFEDGTTGRGFCARYTRKWYTDECKLIRQKVVEWRAEQ